LQPTATTIPATTPTNAPTDTPTPTSTPTSTPTATSSPEPTAEPTPTPEAGGVLVGEDFIAFDPEEAKTELAAADAISILPIEASEDTQIEFFSTGETSRFVYMAIRNPGKVFIPWDGPFSLAFTPSENIGKIILETGGYPKIRISFGVDPEKPFDLSSLGSGSELDKKLGVLVYDGVLPLTSMSARSGKDVGSVSIEIVLEGEETEITAERVERIFEGLFLRFGKRWASLE
jgi:hypothetical protein